MKKLSLSSISLSILTLLFVLISFSSCEQQEAIVDPIEEQIEEPLSHEVLTDRVDEHERIPDCWCKYRGASRRTSSSSYVYCYGYDGIGKTFYLEDLNGNPKGIKSTTSYNVAFHGLIAGRKYRYRTYTLCNRPRYSPWTTFTQGY